MGISALTKSAALLCPELHQVTEEELQQLHRLLLEMMNDIAEICRENGIAWSLSGGSILGAVRHRGFIPWDDDIDLFMFREDLEKFKQVFPGRFSHKYELKLPGDKGYLYHFPKINRKNTIAQSIQSSPEETERVSMDIFVIENTFRSKPARTAHGLLCTALLLADSIMRMDKCRDNLLKYGAGSPELCAAVKKRAFFARFLGFFSMEKWMALSDRAFSMCADSASALVVVPSGTCHFFGEIYRRDKMQKLAPADFENETYYIPEDSDYYLRLRYGDSYMTPPSEDKKERHIFIEFDLNHQEIII